MTDFDRNKTLLDIAYEIVHYAFQDKYRYSVKNGIAMPYASHCYDVASMTRLWGGTIEMILGALFHDIFEDCPDWDNERILKYYKMYALCDPWFPEVESALKIAHELTYIPEEWEDKFAYLAFVAKEAMVASYVVKVADRLCNVSDYSVNDSDRAIKYYNKAQALWDAWDARSAVIAKDFDMKMVLRIEKTRKHVLNCI